MSERTAGGCFEQDVIVPHGDLLIWAQAGMSWQSITWDIPTTMPSRCSFKDNSRVACKRLCPITSPKQVIWDPADFGGVAAASINQIVPPPLTPADFDIRNLFRRRQSLMRFRRRPGGAVGNAILKDWAVDGLLRMSSTPPINVTVGVISPADRPL